MRIKKPSKFHIAYIYVILAIINTGCTDSNITNSNEDKIELQKDSIMMTENGYLAFKDQSTLNNYLESLQNLENNQDPVVRSAHSQRQIPGFRSIAMIKKDCKN